MLEKDELAIPKFIINYAINQNIAGIYHLLQLIVWTTAHVCLSAKSGPCPFGHQLRSSLNA